MQAQAHVGLEPLELVWSRGLTGRSLSLPPVPPIVATSKASSYTRERFRDTLEKRAWSWKGRLSAPYVLDGAPNVSGLYELEAGAASLGKGAFSMCVSPGKHPGLQIRASKFQSSSSTFPRAELANFTGLVLGCIEAKFCK